MLHLHHNRSACIGCAACMELAPAYWKIDDDGLATLLTRTGSHANLDFGRGFHDDLEILQAAVQGCPVKIIRVIRRK